MRSPRGPKNFVEPKTFSEVDPLTVFTAYTAPSSLSSSLIPNPFFPRGTESTYTFPIRRRRTTTSPRAGGCSVGAAECDVGGFCPCGSSVFTLGIALAALPMLGSSTTSSCTSCAADLTSFTHSTLLKTGFPCTEMIRRPLSPRWGVEPSTSSEVEPGVVRMTKTPSCRCLSFIPTPLGPFGTETFATRPGSHVFSISGNCALASPTLIFSRISSFCVCTPGGSSSAASWDSVAS
mmetsp:Transcript_34395/g.90170  ORF Transcript_34395/g.90170 Transcript_34395/m.90170 type:complete len:235 (-) Transcript_34395:53-757(-)